LTKTSIITPESQVVAYCIGAAEAVLRISLPIGMDGLKFDDISMKSVELASL
jgi:hypothetical protein